MDRPALIVVGSGIRVIGQLTTESIAWIKASEKVLYLVSDPVAADVITELNPSAESVDRFYANGKHRRQIYDDIVARVMDCVRAGKRTCLVLYGHPGIFCWPGHESIRQARAEGYSARMLPAISAEDCLFADLGLDPATTGCQSYEATDFLKNDRRIDPSSLLILWQAGAIGDSTFKTKGYDTSALPLLIKRLCQFYSASHQMILYMAPIHWGAEPVVRRVILRKLATVRISATVTLCIPPAQATRPNVEIYQRLRLPLPGQALGEKQRVRLRKVSNKRT